MPSRAAVYGCFSVATLPSAAGPTAAALDVYTTRSTPTRRHSSITIRVPPTFTSNTSSASSGRTDVTPAQWNTRETPRRARLTERRSRTSSFPRRQSRSAITVSGERSCTPSTTSSPRSASSRATCDPMNPVAPVTRTSGKAAECRRSRDRCAPGTARCLRVYAAARMSPVSVVTDSTSYLPPDLVERNGIAVVPLYVVFGGDRTEREIDITDYPAFFEELRTAEKLPTTSQPSVGDFTSVFEPLLENGGEVVSVHISGGLSGTPEAARQAKEALTRDGRGGERIEVVDSTTAAGGLGFMVLAAAKAARDGGSAKEVAQHVAEARGELRLWFAIDTLEFLRRGGRIGAASAWIGSTLKVKPILTVENEMTPVERVRTSSRMFERLVEYARSCADSGADAWSAQHINAPDQCARLVERCTEVYGHGPTIVSEIGPVLSAHTGPGLLGTGAVPSRFVT